MLLRPSTALALAAILTSSAPGLAQPAAPPSDDAGSPVSGPPAVAPQRPLPGQPLLGPYRRVPQPEKSGQGRVDFALRAPPSRHHHDRFYLRLAGGVGRLGDSFASSSLGGSSAGFTGSAAGAAVATEVSAGYSVVPGVALGGGVYTTTLPPTTVVAGNGERYDFSISQLALFCPFVDYYVNPRAGLHFQAGGGLATYVAGQGDPEGYGRRAEAHTALGFGLMAGAGYEWWVSDEWGIGLLGRFIYGWTSGSDAYGGQWKHHINSFAFLLSATYN